MLATLNKISRTHNTCEDSIFVKETDRFIVGCVSDGCSSGENSAFASQLICYVVREMSDLNPATEDFSFSLMRKLADVCNILDLAPNPEMLATVMLFQYDKVNKILKLRCFGDGVYYVNGTRYEIDQKNLPDYMGYYLPAIYVDRVAFIRRYPMEEYHAVESFIICSDGINSFGRSQLAEPTDFNPVEVLLAEPTSKLYLELKFNVATLKKHFYIDDDLSIISYVHDDFRSTGSIKK